MLFSLFLISCEQPTKPIHIWQHSSNGSASAAISHDGQFSVVAGFNEPTGYWNLNTNARLFNWRSVPDSHFSDKDPIQLVAISAENKRVMTASINNFIIWDTASGKSLGYYKAPSQIRAIALSRMARFVLLGLADGRVVFMSLKQGKRLEFLGHRLHAQKIFKDPGLSPNWVGINSVDLSPNGKYAISGGDDHAAIVWDTQSGQQLYLWPHKNRVQFVRFSRDGALAFTSSRQAEAYIWNLKTGKKVASLKLKSRDWIISSARFSADNTQLVTGSPGRDLKIWRVSDGTLLHKFKVKKRFKTKASGAVVLDAVFLKNGHVISESSSGYAEEWTLKNN